MQTISVAARLNTPVCDCTGFITIWIIIVHRGSETHWHTELLQMFENLSLWKELCTKKVMWCYLSGDTCRSAEYCSVFLRFSGGYRWLHLCDDGAASLCQSFKEERLIPLLFSSFGWAKFPVRALETSLDVCEKDGCPGYATHEKQSWCCWITAPVQEAKGFLQTQIQIIFAGPPITFQRALSIAWWKLCCNCL